MSDDLEAFLESKAFAQEPECGSSSCRISNVIDNCEFTVLQDPYDLLIVYAGPNVVLRNVSGTDYLLVKQGIPG